MADIVLLDGGMGQELIHRAGDRPTPLWSTQVMMDHPGMVQAVHADYFAAGVTVATTDTHCVHHDRLETAGLDELFTSLHQAALAAARTARTARAARGTAGLRGQSGPWSPRTGPKCIRRMPRRWRNMPKLQRCSRHMLI